MSVTAIEWMRKDTRQHPQGALFQGPPTVSSFWWGANLFPLSAGLANIRGSVGMPPIDSLYCMYNPGWHGACTMTACLVHVQSLLALNMYLLVSLHITLGGIMHQPQP